MCGFRVTRLVAVVGLLVVLWMSWPAPRQARTLWSAGSGAEPEGFTYHAFPKDPGVALFGEPDQNVIDVLDRALGNELPESIEAPWIRVNVAERSVWVRGSDLVLDPVGLQVEQLLKRYAVRLVRVSGDAHAYASFKQEVRGGQTVQVLTLHFDDYVESYEYMVRGTQIVPLSMKLVDGKAVGFDGAIRFLRSLVILGVVWLVVVVAERVWIWRGKGADGVERGVRNAIEQ